MNTPDDVEWEFDGTCTKCHEALEWAGDDPEVPGDALCNDCLWAERDALKEELAVAKASTAGYTDIVADIVAEISVERGSLKTALAAALAWNKTLDWSEDDKPIPEDDVIKAAHPLRTGKHETYQEAARMVGAKRSKYALVDLVNWLMVERDRALAKILPRSKAFLREERRTTKQALEERDEARRIAEHLETRIRRDIPADPLHGRDGRCICAGEGWCLFCRWAASSEEAETLRAQVPAWTTITDEQESLPAIDQFVLVFRTNGTFAIGAKTEHSWLLALGGIAIEVPLAWMPFPAPWMKS